MVHTKVLLSLRFSVHIYFENADIEFNALDEPLEFPHHVRSKSRDWKGKQFKSLGAIMTTLINFSKSLSGN